MVGQMTTPNYSEIRSQQNKYRPQSDLSASERKAVSFADTPNLDAFGRLRISSPFTIFDSKQIFSKQTIYWDESLTGSATITHQPSKASSLLSTGGSGTAIRQTKRYFTYQPGKSLQIMCTLTLGNNAGATKRLGYFDEGNGVFLEQTPGGLYFVVRSSTTGSPVDKRIHSTDWSIDAFDGYGPSSVKLDPAMSQIMFIDFEWLGVGRVRVGFIVDGVFHVAHEFKHANILSGVYMSTPNLPVRAEISGSSLDTFEQICVTVISEGGFEVSASERAVDSDVSPLVTGTSNIHPALAVRVNSARKGGTFKITGLDVLCTTTSVFRWVLVMNPTLAGGSLSFSETPNSITEIARNAGSTITMSGGIMLASGYSSQGNTAQMTVPIDSFLLPGHKIDGTSDVIVLGIQKITGGTETFYCGLRWVEIL